MKNTVIKRKLTSRKMWTSLATFISMLLIFFNTEKETAESVASLIVAGASVIGYVIGEGLADGGTKKKKSNRPTSDVSTPIQDDTPTRETSESVVNVNVINNNSAKESEVK